MSRIEVSAEPHSLGRLRLGWGWGIVTLWCPQQSSAILGLQTQQCGPRLSPHTSFPVCVSPCPLIRTPSLDLGLPPSSRTSSYLS